MRLVILFPYYRLGAGVEAGGEASLRPIEVFMVEAKRDRGTWGFTAVRLLQLSNQDAKLDASTVWSDLTEQSFHLPHVV